MGVKPPIGLWRPMCFKPSFSVPLLQGLSGLSYELSELFGCVCTRHEYIATLLSMFVKTVISLLQEHLPVLRARVCRRRSANCALKEFPSILIFLHLPLLVWCSHCGFVLLSFSIYYTLRCNTAPPALLQELSPVTCSQSHTVSLGEGISCNFLPNRI